MRQEKKKSSVRIVRGKGKHKWRERKGEKEAEI